MLTFCNICVHFETGTQKPNNRALYTLYSLPQKKKKIIKIELPTKLEKAYGAIFRVFLGAIFRVGINKIEPLYTTQCISRMNHCAWFSLRLVDDGLKILLSQNQRTAM